MCNPAGVHLILHTSFHLYLSCGVFVQKKIYRSEKIRGAVRILKGQEIQQDKSTLIQHNISDGDTINVVIESEKKFHFNVVFGPEKLSYNAEGSNLINDLKKTLINKNVVVFLLEDFDLQYDTFASDSMKKQVKLDLSLPFHYYDFPENEVFSIHLVKTYFLLYITKVGKWKNLLQHWTCRLG